VRAVRTPRRANPRSNIGLRLPNAARMHAELRANVLLVEYRGYGDSDDADPTEEGFKKDAEASLRFVRAHPEINGSKVFLFGRSLGGAVAFHLAGYAQREGMDLAGLVVENTFVSIPRMVDHLMPLVAIFKDLVCRIYWDSGKVVGGLDLPVLYLSGGKDELVPPGQMIELYRKSLEGPAALVKMHVIKDGTHNETWLQGGQMYWDQIKAFLKQAMTTSRQNSVADFIDESDVKCELAVNSGDAVDTVKSSIPLMPTSMFRMAQEIGSSAKKKDN